MLAPLAAAAINEAGGAVRRQVTALAWFGAAAALGLIGLLFVLLALHAWLSTKLPAIQASLVIAGLLFGLAVAAILVGRVIRNRKAKSTALQSTALLAAPAALRLAGSRLPFGALALIGVVVMGAVLGRRIGR
jgi:hypothetical protein